MKAAIISLGSTSSIWTFEAMQKYFDEVDLLDLRLFDLSLTGKDDEILYDGKPMKKYDCVYTKGSFKYASILASISSRINDKTFLPIQPQAFTVAHDKLLTQLELQKQKVPTPKTYLSATIDAAKRILERVNYPIVMKFPKGTHGKGVMFADSYASASSMLDALSALNQPFIIQEFIDTNGTDIRAFVIGDKVVASMERKSDQKEARSNIHLGGKAEPIILNDKTKEIAIKASKSIGAEICGVDILIGPKGPVVLEANVSPGLQGITNTTGVNVADLIAKYLYKQTKKIKDSIIKDKSMEIMQEVDVEQTKELITTVDLRGERILIPEVISKISRIKEEDTIHITASKGKIELKKFF